MNSSAGIGQKARDPKSMPWATTHPSPALVPTTTLTTTFADGSPSRILGPPMLLPNRFQGSHFDTSNFPGAQEKDAKQATDEIIRLETDLANVCNHS